MGQFVDQAQFDREIDEGAGGLNHALVVAQPHQRLDALDLLGPDIDLGLEGAAKALFQDRQPQRLLDLHPRQRLALHAGIEERRGALAAVLDAVHRNVGVLAQHLVAPAVFGIKADADRGGGEYLRLIDEERRLQPLQDEMDVLGDLGVALDRVEQQHEFVAADPRQDVGVAQVHSRAAWPSRPAAHRRRVAVIVVDVLEIVDVEKREREMALSVVALQQPIDAMFDHPPRRQAGQFVIIGRAEQVILERLLLGDVGGTREQQIAARRPESGRWAVRNTCLAGPPAMASSSTAARPVRSNSRQVSRRSFSCEADGAAAAASSKAVAASFTSRNSPCSS